MSHMLPRPDCNAFAIRQAARYVTQVYDRHLGEAGLTSSQFSLLVALAGATGATMASVAEWLVMDRTTLVRALKPMQRDGLVAMKTPPSSRAAELHLTPRGLALLKAGQAHWQAAQAEIDAKFGVERAKAVRQALFELTA